MLVVFAFVAIVANRDQPLNRFATNALRVSQVVNLRGFGTTVDATPFVTFQNKVAFPLPSI